MENTGEEDKSIMEEKSNKNRGSIKDNSLLDFNIVEDPVILGPKIRGSSIPKASTPLVAKSE